VTGDYPRILPDRHISQSRGRTSIRHHTNQSCGKLLDTMASTEKFCLKWNDFENNISQAFGHLRDEKELFDITLVCGETQEQVLAHKVVLAASSQFFRNILRRNPHQHPLLYLKGVKHKELVSILNFIYKGSVNIAQEELSSFLSVAEELKVKGLTQSQSHSNPNKNSHRPEKTSPVTSDSLSNVVNSNISRAQPPSLPVEDDDIMECPPVKHEAASSLGKQETDNPRSQNIEATEAIQERDENFAIRSEYNDQYLSSQLIEHPAADQDFVTEIQSKMFRVSGESSAVWQCSECSYSSKVKCNMTQHIEARHIQHAGYYCFLCHKTCPTKNAFRMHNKRNHEHT